MGQHASAEASNPHTIVYSGAAASTDTTTGETINKIATTLANSLKQDFSMEWDEPATAVEIYNASTNGATLRVSVDGGRSWQTVYSDGSKTFEPSDTSDETGKGFYVLYSLHMIISDVGGRVEVTPHFGKRKHGG